MKRLFIPFLIFISTCLYAQPGRLYPPGEILLQLQKLKVNSSVLYIAAHPDDENTRLLTWFANEKKFRSAYLALTRGDGGQNLIGQEQGDLLGLIRTQELLAARSNDGSEQFFTNARDFGYSKSADESLQIWDQNEVVKEMVWIIRNFRPDIIITRFPTTGEGGHGHHTSSAILAREAFLQAADSTKYPEQLKFVSTWKTGSLWWNTFNFSGNNTTRSDQFKLDAGVFIPLLGKWVGEIASVSRSQHKSQGFGVERGRGEQMEYFKSIDGDTSCGNLFCSIEVLKKTPDNNFTSAIDSAIANFNPANPAEILPFLFAAYNALPELGRSLEPVKRKSLEQIIFSCAGLWFEANALTPFTTPGDSVRIRFSVVCKQSDLFTLNKISVGTFLNLNVDKSLGQNQLETITGAFALPLSTPYTNPYWLNSEGSNGMFAVTDYSTIGKPVSPPALFSRFSFIYKGQVYEFDKPVNYKWTDPVKGECYKDFEIKPPVVIAFDESLVIFSNRKSRTVKVTLQANSDQVEGKINFAPLQHFRLIPAVLNFSIEKKNSVQTFDLRIEKITDRYVTENLTAEIQMTSLSEIIPAYTQYEIHYDHIPEVSVIKKASLKVESMDLKINNGKIGYITGSGDATVSTLRQAGFDIEILENVLSEQELKKYKAIITGIRAYNTNEKMIEWQPALMNYVQQGGTLIVQYNTMNFISTLKSDPGPYPFKISRERVTDEHAAVDFLAPDSPLMLSPNKLTKDDFSGWVQERGIYFAVNYKDHYKPLFRMNDKGETNGDGSLIFARFGKGTYIYTGLSLFRQLPAGVSGAYRLMSNLVEGLGTE
ncbi:MAG: PIG-L family deacetylase [Bacteroidia bacterium]|nr:PIG-L family deacetylase [Bacteroidia bacterium]